MVTYDNDNVYNLVINIPNDQVSLGNVVYDEPIPDDQQYITAVFSQHSMLSIPVSNNFDLESFILANQLELVNYETYGERSSKYCRCLIHVAAKNSPECNLNKNWGGKCYNPYAVCAKSTKSSTRGCFKTYDYYSLNEAELLAVANLKGIVVKVPYDRDALIANLEAASRD